jgi:type I restriction enzyme S subunit
VTTVPLAELVRPAGKKAGADTDLPVYSVTKHAGFVPSLEYFKKQVFSRDVASYKVVERGEFAYATIHLDEGSIGIAPERALISPMYTVFKTDDSRVDPKYLIRFLKSPRALTHYTHLGKGAVHRRKAISLTALGALPVPLPPLFEQRRIAAILDHADDLRAKRRQVLTHLDTLTQSIFHDMFGSELETRPFAEFVSEFRYGTSNKSGENGLPTLRIPNVVSGALSIDDIKTVTVGQAEQARLTLHEGDLLFVRTNGNPDNVGRVAPFSYAEVEPWGHAEAWIYASYLIRARLSNAVLPAVAAAYMSSARGRRLLRDRAKTSAGQYNINIAGIGSVPFPIVPLTEQQAYVAMVERIEARRAAVERALGSNDELFASLQSSAFRGEL